MLWAGQKEIECTYALLNDLSHLVIIKPYSVTQGRYKSDYAAFQKYTLVVAEFGTKVIPISPDVRRCILIASHRVDPREYLVL